MGCFVLNPELRLANVLCLALNAAAFAAFFRCIIFEYYIEEINFEPTYISRSRMERCSNRGKSWLRRERVKEREREGEYDSDAKHFQPISWTKSARLESQEEHHYVMLLIQFLFLLFRRCFYFWNIVSFKRFFQVRFQYTIMLYIVSFCKNATKTNDTE